MAMQKPSDHPVTPTGKTGVLIANLGTPDGTDYWSMRRYLGEFLSDKRVVDLPRWKWQPILQLIILTFRPTRSGKAYASIWNHEADESPLLTITRAQYEKLQTVLKSDFGENVEVEFSMRYGNPSTESRVNSLVEKGCRRIVFMPLYPQYAGATWATANDQMFRALMKTTWQPAVRTVEPYFDHPDYIKALAASVSTAYEKLDQKPDLLVASYHGVPKRYLMQGDPYHCHCQKTTRLLQEALGWQDDQITTTFQSKFGREEWLQPYTVEEIARLAKAGKKNIAVIAPAFSSDCIETLEEINEEIKESFMHAGGENFTYVPCLNNDDAHIQVMRKLVHENAKGWLS
ncbi:MAG: ferrochelatase [Paracoccaceae bacterium]|jgi:ferrochelatase